MAVLSLASRRLFTVVMAFAAACAAAVSRASEGSHPCASIVDDADRLECYDAAFGAPSTPANGAEKTRDKPAFSFTAVIGGLERRGGRFVATLDNGQVWSQTETNTRIEVRVGDSVTIRRGALGSYLLSNAAGLATRVKRLR
jgi:hypothetical protein